MKKFELDREIAPHFEAALEGILEYHDTQRRLVKKLRHFEKALPPLASESDASTPSDISRLIGTAKTFLDFCRLNPKHQSVPFRLAAVEYFLEHNDAIDDFSDFDGFEDDKAVFLAVEQSFGSLT